MIHNSGLICFHTIFSPFFYLNLLVSLEMCPSPQEIMHGSYFIHGSGLDIQDAYQYKLSTVITYKCDTGYRLIGPSSIECVQGSQWSHHAPQCVTYQGRNISYDYVVHQSVLGFTRHRIPFVVNSMLLHTPMGYYTPTT